MTYYDIETYYKKVTIENEELAQLKINENK